MHALAMSSQGWERTPVLLLRLWLALVGLSGIAPMARAQEPAISPLPSESIPAFELTTAAGVPWRLEEHPTQPVLVVFVGVECPLVGQYIPTLHDLADRYQDRLEVILIDSNQQDSLADLEEFHRRHDLKLTLLKDTGHKIADQFQAERTPEAFLLDNQRQVRYRGRIDDRFHYGVRREAADRDFAGRAIAQLLAGQPIEEPRVDAIGCQIGRKQEAVAGAEVTYCGQVAAILNRHCVRCHRAGEIGPFALTDFQEIAGWSETIAEVVSDGRMPPWHASPEHGQFINDGRLSDTERETLVRWAELGAPYGDPQDLPPSPQFVEGWQITQPDRVIAMSDKPYELPAVGALPYQYFVVDPQFTEDVWVRAAECRPGNPAVVHHIIVGIQPPDGTPNLQASEWLTATAPGARPLDLPEGLAKRIPAGSKLVFQMHYTPNGKPTSDLSQVGLVFADPTTVRREVVTQQAANVKFEIPPGASKHRVDAWYRFAEDSLVLALFPHMHLRGHSFRYIAHRPDGSTEILLDVPRYDFNWQNAYIPVKPWQMPAGTRLQCIATFDNSAENPFNPDPKATVRWGDQTWEEMMIGYFDMHRVKEDGPAAAESP